MDSQQIGIPCARRLTTPVSVALSKDLKARGWSFVGPTTIYAFMQAMGLVNDHVEGCYVRDAVARDRKRLKPPVSTAARR